MFVYPKDEMMDETAVNAFINKNRGFTAKIYDRNMQYYLGKHDILKKCKYCQTACLFILKTR